jgi:hypothetical protein
MFHIGRECHVLFLTANLPAATSSLPRKEECFRKTYDWNDSETEPD